MHGYRAWSLYSREYIAIYTGCVLSGLVCACVWICIVLLTWRVWILRSSLVLCRFASATLLDSNRFSVQYRCACITISCLFVCANKYGWVYMCGISMLPVNNAQVWAVYCHFVPRRLRHLCNFHSRVSCFYYTVLQYVPWNVIMQQRDYIPQKYGMRWRVLRVFFFFFFFSIREWISKGMIAESETENLCALLQVTSPTRRTQQRTRYCRVCTEVTCVSNSLIDSNRVSTPLLESNCVSKSLFVELVLTATAGQCPNTEWAHSELLCRQKMLMTIALWLTPTFLEELWGLYISLLYFNL